MQRAELERPADDAAARLEEGREHIETIKLRTTIHEVGHLGGGAADPDVVAGGGVYGGIVRTREQIRSLGRLRPGQYDEPQLLQLRGGVRWGLAPCRYRAEPVEVFDGALTCAAAPLAASVATT